jgi:uroporphyrinogen-III synthase
VIPLLVLRPQPGAEATAARARALGLAPVVAPLFAVRPIAAEAPPPDGYDAVLLTSANAVRHGARLLAPFAALPVYAVGAATAAAARAAGLEPVRVGDADGAALVAMMADDGIAAALHPCGRAHKTYPNAPVRLHHLPVYASEPVPPPAGLFDAPAVALVHSPRAARRLSALVRVEGRRRIAVAAISPAAATAAGTGWRDLAAAERPDDGALLALAAKLCQNGGR